MRNFRGMPVRIRETKGTSRRGPAKPPRDREFPLTRAENHSRRGRSQGIQEDPVLLSEAGIRLAGSRSPRPPFRRVRKTVRGLDSADENVKEDAPEDTLRERKGTSRRGSAKPPVPRGLPSSGPQNRSSTGRKLGRQRRAGAWWAGLRADWLVLGRRAGAR
ncbi:unnamed protein product [Rangifer tarandus platyrhynchus]|nr:unnamed protein product [Rangifer tarandus platyrhynchus]